VLATFDSVPRRCGTQENEGRGRIGPVLPFAYGPALRAVSAKHGPVGPFVVVFERLQGHHAKPVAAYSALSQFNYLLRDKPCGGGRLSAAAETSRKRSSGTSDISRMSPAQTVDRRERDGLAIDFHPRTSCSVHTLRLQFIDVKSGDSKTVKKRG
jgi:hypothetical protein